MIDSSSHADVLRKGVTDVKKPIVTLSVLVSVTGAIVVAQNALAQFKVSEAQARDTILAEMGTGVGGHSNRTVVEIARKAFGAIPASARGAAATALYAWTRTYVSSPPFKTAYAAFRKETAPVERVHVGTVDEALAREVAQKKAELDKSVKDYLAAGMKAQADAMRAQGKMFDDKMFLQMTRMSIEQKRASDKEAYTRAHATFLERLPPDPMDGIANHLRAFLETTPDVDFAAKRHMVRNGVGTPWEVFVNDAYNKKPWQWQLAFEFGADVTRAARTAAAAWLKETGR